ncbi:hypothetical protein FOCC_FOCC001175 [Frankliniella occidentalis]|nr:hypothetical protein FOCC_FOCC001175 [Frankliniella occidentalis]
MSDARSGGQCRCQGARPFKKRDFVPRRKSPESASPAEITLLSFGGCLSLPSPLDGELESSGSSVVMMDIYEDGKTELNTPVPSPAPYQRAATAALPVDYGDMFPDEDCTPGAPKETVVQKPMLYPEVELLAQFPRGPLARKRTALALNPASTKDSEWMPALENVRCLLDQNANHLETRDDAVPSLPEAPDPPEPPSPDKGQADIIVEQDQVSSHASRRPVIIRGPHRPRAPKYTQLASPDTTTSYQQQQHHHNHYDHPQKVSKPSRVSSRLCLRVAL